MRPRQPIFVEFQGDNISLNELANRTGLPYYCIYQRWRDGKRGEALWAPSKYSRQRTVTTGEAKAVTIKIKETKDRELSDRARRREKDQARLDKIAAARAEHAAAFSKPLIDASLLSTAERNQIQRNVGVARGWGDAEQEDELVVDTE